jgi:5-methyltetrahydrofolate--homocysteine methyltransferase
MQYVAAEMQGRPLPHPKIPADWRRDLLTRAHRQKNYPHYEGPVVYVPDASRSVSVAQSLLSDQARSTSTS